jgi:hypothetical protein
MFSPKLPMGIEPTKSAHCGTVSVMLGSLSETDKESWECLLQTAIAARRCLSGSRDKSRSDIPATVAALTWRMPCKQRRERYPLERSGRVKPAGKSTSSHRFAGTRRTHICDALSPAPSASGRPSCSKPLRARRLLASAWRRTTNLTLRTQLPGHFRRPIPNKVTSHENPYHTL